MTQRAPLPLRPGFWLAVAAAALVAVAALWTAMPRPAAVHGTTYEPVAPAPEFRLTDHDGRSVSLAELRGRPVLLFFGYTPCPDVCPLTLQRLARAVKALGGDADDVRVLLVTVDPARDTPAVLKAYAARFGPFVTGLTGAPEELERARRGYGAYVAERAGAGEHAGHGAPRTSLAEMVHSSVVYGIDREGNLRVVISDPATGDEVRDDVRTLARL